jgi:hypothetical protein
MRQSIDGGTTGVLDHMFAPPGTPADGNDWALLLRVAR